VEKLSQELGYDPFSKGLFKGTDTAKEKKKKDKN
jgi:hypothetical protein